MPDGRILTKHDNDDDGEDAAGSKLAYLLDMRKDENVLVVVSRWYGGIHLGPKRFAHIINVARVLLLG
jgi:putative IMPACT (imprinted ancient) family translation regulator